MKILSINQHDIVGGAAIAAYRLHRSLIKHGVNSSIMVDNKKSSDPNVVLFPRKRLIEELTSRVAAHSGLNYIPLLGTLNIFKHPLFLEADIINFHNIHGGYFNYLFLPSITQHKPTIFSLHDMWSFTGHCSSSLSCLKWENGCGNCPYLDIYPSVKRDLTHLEWQLKNWIYKRSKMIIVTPSQWLTNCVSRSILKDFSIVQIPHGIDLEIYRPISQGICRDALGLPRDKKIILFSAQSLINPLKGGETLFYALNQLPNSLKSSLLLLTLGEGGEGLKASLDIPVLSLGYISGDHIKAIAYSAADIFILPTLADVFGLVLIESMACGTPIIASSVGGVPELVRSGVTGELAQPENILEFTQKIIELLEDTNKREVLSKNCRHIAKMEYSIELQTDRYVQLYQQCLSRS